MFLTESQIIRATGCVQPAAQEAWFRERGFNAYRNRKNEVIVSSEAFVRWQLGERSQVAREPVLRMRVG